MAGCREVISDALFQEIQGSRTYIAVLSENYAFSPWCLDELVEFVKCSKTMQSLVIPVFYNIDPSVAWRQIGSFSKAFEKHQIRLAGKIEKVNEWRLALMDIADFSGQHVHAERYRRSGFVYLFYMYILYFLITEIIRQETLFKIHLFANPSTLSDSKHITHYYI